MATKTKYQWHIRDSKGKITGPYNKDAIINLISRGVIQGDEQIAINQANQWVPLASIPEFYDLLISNLESGQTEIKQSDFEKMEAKTVVITRNQIPKSRVLGSVAGDATQKADSSHFAELTRTIKASFAQLINEMKGGSVPTKEGSSGKKEKKKFVPIDTSIPTMTTNDSNQFSQNPIITSLSKITQLDAQKIVVGTSVIIVLLMIVFIFSEDDTNQPSSEGKVHLLAPTSTKSGYLTPDESKALLMRVKYLFEMDNLSNWIEAQNTLVKMAEAEPTNTEVRELLCLTYKELWPFAYQDAEDMQVLNHMSQTTRTINPSIRHGKTCELIRYWLTGKFQEAKSQLELLIQEYSNISFYIWLKTDMLISENDFINGQGFASSLITIWPEFIRGKILSVHASLGIGQFQKGREILVKILQQNPEHKVAKLMLGDIEFKHFQQDERAWDLLITGLKSDELAPRQVLVNAYMTLALLSEKKGDLSLARKYSELGFELNPTNERLREMVKKFGGSDKNFNEAARTQELVSIGDHYVRSGDCLAAQAQYRAAFDLNPHHPVAAVKAAKCLYRVNQIFQAFEYLKKAIRHNPDYFPAYTLLADYYSQKFDFNSAMGILNQARTYSTEAYEIYKGFALVELRKNNFTGALGYTHRANTIYSTDPDTYVIKSKAHYGMNQPKEAFQAAQKAIEIDPINIEGQIAYGKAMALIQGDNTGLEYLTKLVQTNKYILEYKLALADFLRDLERYSEALPLYEELVAVDPKNKKAQIGLGDSLNGLGKVESSLSAYLLAATFDPTDPEPIVRAGLLYLDTSRLDPAIQQFERALVINKNYPKAYYYIGKAAFLKGDLQKALDAAIAERKANPNIVESYLLAAEVYMVMRKFTQCTAEYQQAIKIRPQGGDNYVKLAKCYRLSGSYDIAESMLDIAAEKESGYADIYKERGALYQIQGNKEAAYKSYEKYLALSPNAPDKYDIEALMNQLSIRYPSNTK